jgi:hypothetical protein
MMMMMVVMDHDDDDDDDDDMKNQKKYTSDNEITTEMTPHPDAWGVWFIPLPPSGQWEDGLRSGAGVCIYASGEKFEGLWSCNQPLEHDYAAQPTFVVPLHDDDDGVCRHFLNDF